MSKIIVVANQKGGVAKTSTVRNLSYSLAELGKKVLTVDLDPQSNLTIGFGIICCIGRISYDGGYGTAKRKDI